MSTEKHAPTQTDAQAAQRLLAEFPPVSDADWRAAAIELLQGAPFEKRLLTKTYEGLTLQPIYTSEDWPDSSSAPEFPGFAPYRRGISPSVAWDVAQEYRCALPEQMNAALRADLSQGQDALAFHFDQAGKQGQDPNAAAADAVGRGGMSLATSADVQALFAGLDVASTPLLAHTGAATIPFAALFFAFCRQQGLACENLHGALGFDPLGWLAVSGNLPFSGATAYALLAAFTRWALRQTPHLKTIAVDSYPYYEGGGSVVQELACVLATGVEYLRALKSRELSIDAIAARMQFTVTVGAEYFLEIAKLRAARVLWAKVVKACGGGVEAQKMFLHVRTSLRGKTVHDPYVNMLRVSVEAFAAVMGGAESLHVGGFDDVVKADARAPESNAFANRIARNVQIILKAESHLNKVSDPAGGSWYVERLTDDIARKAWALFQQIEQQGGMAQALESGFIQAQLAATAAQRRANLSTRKDVLVGTNLYANLDEQPLQPNLPDSGDVYRVRLETLQAFKAARKLTPRPLLLQREGEQEPLTPNPSPKRRGEDWLPLSSQERGPGGEFFPDMETLITAASQGATLGELMCMCCSASDIPISITPVIIQRPAEMFERLRASSDAYQKANGHRPYMFLAKMGPPRQYQVRADFAQAFFEVAGFEILSNDGFQVVDEAAEASIRSRAPIVVICSTDDTYPDIVPPLTRKIKSANPETIVILAGYPPEHVETFRQAGIDEFIHLRADVYDTLFRIMQALGMMSKRSTAEIDH